MELIQNLRLVEIELFSYCNRKCTWCPNSYIDRQNDIKYLDSSVFHSLLCELKQNGYTGKFSFSRYNEPFSDVNLLNWAIGYIKKIFPEAITVSNTNGDYITEEVLKTMFIDELTIMDYDRKGKEYVFNKLQEWHVSDIQEYDHYFVGTYYNKKILYYYSWTEVAKISDRGGNLVQYSLNKREAPCYEPLFFIGVNYDGTVSPCCNVRSDCKNQKDYILGNLKQQSLTDMLYSEKYLTFLKNVIQAKYTPDMPCYYCNNGGGRYTREKGGILY